jgi:hypothetical protein
MQISEESLRKLIREEILKSVDAVNESPSLSEGIRWHLEEGVSFDQPIYRAGSEKYFALIREARFLYQIGSYSAKNEFEKDMLESNLGEWDMFENDMVPLDFPMLEEDLDEAKYKGREVTLGAKGAKRSGGRAHVYVRNPKTGKVKKVSFGSGMPDAMGDSPKHRARRKSFAARHRCSKNKDRTSASYWACRATKMFGRNVPGWW